MVLVKMSEQLWDISLSFISIFASIAKMDSSAKTEIVVTIYSPSCWYKSITFTLLMQNTKMETLKNILDTTLSKDTNMYRLGLKMVQSLVYHPNDSFISFS